MSDPMSDLLARAIALAARAHLDQRDKAGLPYVLHPLRMMFRLTQPAARIAAVLHDLVEDTEWELADLEKEGFPAEIVTAVDALTKRAGEEYGDFVARAATNPIARLVKLADLEDNMDLTRLSTAPNQKDFDRLSKYHQAWLYLKSLQGPLS
jgi:(p)ppGpp synthase/HD superfamily hydrolase